jgi:extracellular matrix protein 14
VVRFNVTKSEEEGVLAQAVEQMFLDVWAFTPEYVDVRLDKDDVPALLTLLPKSLEPSVLIPDVAAAVWATYPSASVKTSRLESSMADAAKMRTSLDGVGNVFFQNYQTLAVRRTVRRFPIPLMLTLPRLSRPGCACSRLCSHQSRA